MSTFYGYAMESIVGACARPDTFQAEISAYLDRIGKHPAAAEMIGYTYAALSSVFEELKRSGAVFSGDPRLNDTASARLYRVTGARMPDAFAAEIALLISAVRAALQAGYKVSLAAEKQEEPQAATPIEVRNEFTLRPNITIHMKTPVQVPAAQTSAEPIEVRVVAMPDRQRVTEITRNGAGEIATTVAIEHDTTPADKA